MVLNLVITGIVGFIILILWILKRALDAISLLDLLIKRVAKVTDLLHSRLSRIEIMLEVDQEKAKKEINKLKQ